MKRYYCDLRYEGESLDGALITFGKIKSVDNANVRMGFRTAYTEWYPTDNKILFGYNDKAPERNDCVNHNALLGNRDKDGERINNLVLNLNREGQLITYKFTTIVV